MAGNRTLTIIKPDAFNSGKSGLIIALLEKAGFKIVASRVMRLTDAQAGYSVVLKPAVMLLGYRKK